MERPVDLPHCLDWQAKLSEKYATDIDLSNNLDQVMNRISAAKQRARRSSESVRLVAISKGQEAEKIVNAYDAGLRDFGENRVHEALPKQEQLARYPAIRWHMVGHIQSRKARRLVPGFDFVHSVDRLKIARRLNDAAHDAQMNLAILLECNVSGESTKQGWQLWKVADWDSSLTTIESVLNFSNLNVIGLMTMAPWTDDSERIRAVFQRLSALRDFYAQQLPGSWKELSMGMTDDFEIAIEEGATILRIGRAIFGARDLKT